MPDDIVLAGPDPTLITDDVAICNLALAKIGNADNYLVTMADLTKEGRLCRLLYLHVLNICIDDYPWNCMVATTTLVIDVTVPSFGYDHTYPLPDDCIRVLSLTEDGTTDDDSSLDWRRIGRYIYTNADTLYLTYLWNNTSVSTYDPRFIQAFASRLAIELAPSITGNKQVVALLWEEYKAIISEMRLLDAIEDNAQERGSQSMIDVRD
jgi:hypothetical protein